MCFYILVPTSYLGHILVPTSHILETTIKKLEKQALVEDKTWDDFGDGNIGGLSLWDEELASSSAESLMGLADCLEAKIQGLAERIKLLRGKQTTPSTHFLVF